MFHLILQHSWTLVVPSTYHAFPHFFFCSYSFLYMVYPNPSPFPVLPEFSCTFFKILVKYYPLQEAFPDSPSPSWISELRSVFLQYPECICRMYLLANILIICLCLCIVICLYVCLPFWTENCFRVKKWFENLIIH